MKKLLKTISTLLIAVLLALTSFAATVSALDGTETATVTVESLQEGDKVKLYQIVEPDINSNDKLEGYKFTENAKNTLVDPDEKVTLTLAKDNKTYSITKKAIELDVDKDGLIDSKVTLASVEATAEGDSDPTTLTDEEWTVDSNKVGDVVYNMKQPTQQQINLAVNKLNLGSLTSQEVTVGEGATYAQAVVTGGQYLGIVTPGANNNKTYNPIVLSAGYEGLQAYKLADTGADGTFYKKVNGTYTNDANELTKDNVHLFENAKWDEENNMAVFKDTDTTTGVTAGDEYKPLYVKDGETTSDQLIAKDLDTDSSYTWTMSGTTAIPKSSTPDISKTHETDTHEDNRQVALLAVDSKGDPLVNVDDSLVYIKAPYTKNQYIELLGLDETKKYKWNDTLQEPKWEESSADDAVGIADLRTDKFKEASTISEAKVYTGGQGEEIRYTLEPTIPQYPANAKNRTFVITDNLSSGLDYVEGSLNMTIENYDVERDQNNSDGTYSFFVYESVGTVAENSAPTGTALFYKNGEVYHPVMNQSADTEVYTRKEFAKLAEKDVCTTLMADNDNDFQINFIYENLPGQEGAKKSPKITYKGVLTDQAIEGVEGNPNVAKAYYARNTGDDKNWDVESFKEPKGEDYNEWRDVKKVYTYELRFRKTNEKPEYKQDNSGEYYILLSLDELKESSTYKGAGSDGKKALEDAWFALTQGDGVELYTQGEVMMADESVENHYLTKTAPTTDTQALYTTIRANKNVGNTNQADDFVPLEGAVFGVYSDSDCKTLVTEVKVNSDGIGFTTKINGGDYWLKEITPPVGYTLSTEKYGPIHVDWTTATVETTEGASRKVYTVDLTKALNHDGDENNANKPVKKDSPAAEGVDPNTISATAGNVIHPDQVGWLVGTGEKSKFYENQVYDVAKTTPDWTYYEDKTTVGTTTYEAHTMVHKDGTQINNVFRAYLEKFTTTETTGSATYYNNNGGTYDLNRIKNSKNAELPSTGGIGTYMFTIAGVAILATAAFMLIFRKKESSK